jgi:uncharacterized membrane protein YozB (DUF420 family)
MKELNEEKGQSLVTGKRLNSEKKREKRKGFILQIFFVILYFFCLILDRDGLSKVNPWLNSRVLSPLDGQAKK